MKYSLARDKLNINNNFSKVTVLRLEILGQLMEFKHLS